MLWFNFFYGLNFISLCYKLIIMYYDTPKRREIRFKPRIKLNHNIKILPRDLRCSGSFHGSFVTHGVNIHQVGVLWQLLMLSFLFYVYQMNHSPEYDVAVIGAGISGIVTAKCLLDDKFNIIVYEMSDHVGGLWQFTEDGYGVMRFTTM